MRITKSYPLCRTMLRVKVRGNVGGDLDLIAVAALDKDDGIAAMDR